MGESKRKRKAEAEFRAASFEAGYRPGRTLLVCDLDAGEDDMLFEALVQARTVGPSAMDAPGRLGEPGAAGPDLSGLMDLDGGAVCWDEATAALRPATPAERDMPALPGMPMVRYAFEGPERTYIASRDAGLMTADRAPVADPVAEMRGLLRVDAAGAAVAQADAPLYLQALQIEEAPATGGIRTEQPGIVEITVPMHLLHLVFLHAQLLRSPCRDRGAWIDEALYHAAIVGADGGDPGDANPDDEAWNRIQDVLEVAAAHGPGTAPGLLGPRLRIAPDAWIRRDTPGYGLLWARIDRRAAQVLPEDARPGPAAWLVPSGPTDAIVSPYLAGLEPSAGDRGEGAYRDGGIGLARLSVDGYPHLLATAPGDVPAPAGDPLMTEDLEGTDASGLPSVRRFAETLGELDLITAMPDPPPLADYPILALLKAAAEGATFADFCASYAAAARYPEDDPDAMRAAAAALADEEAGDATGRSPDPVGVRLARRHAACERLAALGGTPRPRIMALLARNPSEVGFAEFERDARLLIDAAGGGAGLGDLALELAESGIYSD